MSAATRTPEGQPHRCPVCGNNVCVEPSLFYGDAPCPHCGTLLWFLNARPLSFTFEHSAELEQRILDYLAGRLGLDRETIHPGLAWKEVGADSLDVVELVMEIEEEFGGFISDD